MMPRATTPPTTPPTIAPMGVLVLPEGGTMLDPVGLGPKLVVDVDVDMDGVDCVPGTLVEEGLFVALGAGEADEEVDTARTLNPRLGDMTAPALEAK